jgi:hypothetical protein
MHKRRNQRLCAAWRCVMPLVSFAVIACATPEAAKAGGAPPNSVKELDGSEYSLAREDAMQSEKEPVLDLDDSLGSDDSVNEPSDYLSRPVGSKQRWQFDSGYFEYDNQQSNRLPSGDTRGDYSGFRLRRARQKD